MSSNDVYLKEPHQNENELELLMTRNKSLKKRSNIFLICMVILAVNLLAVVIWWAKSDMKTRVKDTQLSRQLKQSEERIKSLESELEHARMDILTQRRIAAELDERLTICLERR